MRALAALLAWAVSAAPAAACSVCVGNADSGSPMITGTRLGVSLLLAITVAILGGFVKFFLYLRRRAILAERDAIALEWAQLQRSSLT